MRIHHRFFRRRDSTRVREIGGVIDILCLAVGHCDLIYNRWCCCDEVKVVFSFQSFLNNFHMEKSQESAAEAEAQGDGCFRLE